MIGKKGVVTLGKQVTWSTVAMMAVLGLVTVGLARYTRWESGEILGLVGILAGIGGGAAVAGGVSGRVDRIAAETTEQSSTLQTIQRKVNGELDERIAAAVQQGNADLMATLERRGMVR